MPIIKNTKLTYTSENYEKYFKNKK